MGTETAGAAAVSTYLRDFSDSIALLGDSKRFDFGHIRGVFTGRAMFNRFYDAAYPSLVTAADIPRLAAVAAEEKCRPVWLLDMDHIDAGLSDALQSHGFVRKAEWSGMWRDVEDLPRVDQPNGLSVRRVDDDATLRVWSRVCVDVEEFTSSQEETFTDLFLTLQRQHAGWTHLIAGMDGRPVATASLLITNRIAAVDWVNTLPEARRRGIAHHLVSRLLHEAAGSYDVAVLTSTADGESLYRRLGFQHCSRVSAWRLSG